MCGEDPNIRIEKAGNGYVIDSYTPGKRGKRGEHTPGVHKRHVATGKHHVTKLLGQHLKDGGKEKSEAKKGKRKSARKRS